MVQFNRKQRKGFTLIELLIVIAVIAILAAIAIPNLLASRKSANEASAIGSLRTINSAEATYRSRNTAYGDLPTLLTAQLVDPALGGATAAATAKSGYVFAVAVGAGALNATQYYATAEPASVGTSGDRYFYTDETGTLYQNAAGPVVTAHAAAGAGPAGYSQVGN